VLIWKARFIDTWGRITLETFQTCFMSHLSQSTHNNTLSWMDETSAYLNWYPVFQCSQKQWVVSLQASLSPVLVSHCLHVPQKGKSKICVKFSPIAWIKKDAAVQNYQIKQMGKQLFHPLPCLMADWATIRHSATFIHITPVMVLIRSHFWFYHIALFIAEISFLCWMVNVSHHAVVCLVHPLYCCQVAPGPYLNVPLFQFHCLAL
jgi:hypothetical protein